MQKIYSRGLNYHGQCGLGSGIKYTEKFLPIEINEKIRNIYTNYGASYALLQGNI
jgi:hypothetical protein